MRFQAQTEALSQVSVQAMIVPAKAFTFSQVASLRTAMSTNSTRIWVM